MDAKQTPDTDKTPGTARSSHSRPATARDFRNPALHDAQTGLFYGVSGVALRLLRQHARVRTFAAAEIVFREGDDSKDTPFIVALTAQFRVQHDIDSDSFDVGEDGPGVILADVELLVRGVDADTYRRGATDSNLSTVVCSKAGEAIEIYPASVLWETKSFALARNVARLVAIKLLRRTSQSDPNRLGESRRLVRYLQTLIGATRRQKNASLVAGRVLDRVYAVGLLRSEVPADLNIGSSTRYSFFAKLKRLTLPQHGVVQGSFFWEGKIIFMSTAFYRVLMEHPEALWERQN